MSLSDLASIGTFVSSIAMVISLISLTLQLRQNTAALERAEANATQSQASAFRLAIVNSRDVAKLLVVGSADDGNLDEIDDARFGALLGERIWFLSHVWDREQRGLLAKGVWERVRSLAAEPLTTKRGALWWDRNRGTFPPEFALAVDVAIGATKRATS